MFKSLIENVTGIHPPKKIWTVEEDALLLSVIERVGFSNWTLIGQEMPNRTGKQCRERWCNHLHPDLKKTDWTEEEDRIIETCQQLIGNQWSKITKALPGRTDNSAKNRFHANAKLRGKIPLYTRDELKNMGIVVTENDVICSFSNPSRDKKTVAPHQVAEAFHKHQCAHPKAPVAVAIPVPANDRACFKPNSLSSSPIDSTLMVEEGVNVEHAFSPVCFDDFDATTFEGVFDPEMDLYEEENEGCMDVCSSQLKHMWSASSIICAPAVPRNNQQMNFPPSDAPHGQQSISYGSTVDEALREHEAMEMDI